MSILCPLRLPVLVVALGGRVPGKVGVSGSLGSLTADLPCMFCSYSYMIDNVILLITGTLHQRSITELVPKCHPLGSFEQMEAVNIAQTPAELYNAILVDTPLGEPCWGEHKHQSTDFPAAAMVTACLPLPPLLFLLPSGCPRQRPEPGESRQGGLASGKPELQAANNCVGVL